MQKRVFPHKVDDNGPIWTEFRELTEKYNCLSLGEGAPGYNPPKFLRDKVIEAIDEGHNQYSRIFGIPELVIKISEVYGKKLCRKFNPMTEVLVTAGANTALNAFITAIIDPELKEEVVLFEPCFPQYQDHIQLAGGIYKPVPLELKDGKWTFDVELFRKSLTPKTKIFILNNAHNPTGKLFSLEELETITKILEEFPNIIVLSDDVYESLTFDGKQSTLFGSIGNNYEKTVSIFSGGKLFSATGWKVGWALGPADIISAASLMTMAITYCVNAPAQIGMARSLGLIEDQPYIDDKSYVEFMKDEFQKVRDYFIKELSDGFDIPLEPLKSESGYFLMIDISKCRDVMPKRYLESHEFEELKDGEKPIAKNSNLMEDGRVPLDLAFCRWIAVERGVIMMPCSLFYHKASTFRNDHYVRLAICKGMDHSIKAMERLKQKKE